MLMKKGCRKRIDFPSINLVSHIVLIKWDSFYNNNDSSASTFLFLFPFLNLNQLKYNCLVFYYLKWWNIKAATNQIAFKDSSYLFPI